MSIVGGVDVDSHAQGDLAIGAPGNDSVSGNVVVLRTLEVAFLKPKTEIEMHPNEAIMLEDTGDATRLDFHLKGVLKKHQALLF